MIHPPTVTDYSYIFHRGHLDYKFSGLVQEILMDYPKPDLLLTISYFNSSFSITDCFYIPQRGFADVKGNILMPIQYYGQLKCIFSVSLTLNCTLKTQIQIDSSIPLYLPSACVIATGTTQINIIFPGFDSVSFNRHQIKIFCDTFDAHVTTFSNSITVGSITTVT